MNDEAGTSSEPAQPFGHGPSDEVVGPKGISEELSPEAFYERTSWPLGTVVADSLDASCRGMIVKRGGRIWANRDRLPLVRWNGRIDAEPVPWHRLEKLS